MVVRMDRILLLEDEAALRHSLSRLLRQDSDLTIREAGSLKDALALLDERPSLVVSDLDLPDGSGLDLLQELTFRGLNVPVIIITAYLSRFRGLLPVSSNVDILEKPLDSEELISRVRQRLAPAKSAPPRSAFTVADYLQLAGLARRNVRLTITGEGGARGKIVVQDGQTTWAEDQLGDGIAAFRRLAMLPRAEVVCKADDTTIASPNVQGSLEQLLLDAARAHDEHERALAAEESRDSGELDSLLAAPREKEPVSEVSSAGAGAAGTRRRPSSSTLRLPKVDVVPPRLPPRPALSAVGAESAPGSTGSPGSAGAMAAPPLPKAAGRAAEIGQKEKPMTMMKPLKPVTSLDKLVTQQNTLSGAARAKKDGSVIDLAGEIDADTTCAVVTVASHHIEELAADLGLGELSSWHLSMGKSTWYVATSADEMVVALGGPNKNPTSTLSKVEESFGKRS
jgi:DNA-binding response OmpR family regulator